MNAAELRQIQTWRKAVAVGMVEAAKSVTAAAEQHESLCREYEMKIEELQNENQRLFKELEVRGIAARDGG